jgi:sigma-B regulation protein RsbU (phosphoserine phosphatase)
VNPANGDAIPATDFRPMIGHQESVQAKDMLEDVHKRFAQHQHEYMAVLDGSELIGLCARRQVGMTLGARFGFAMYSRRPIREMMLPAATRISVNDPLADVLHRVFTRADEIFFDDVLLVDGAGRFLGLIFARTLVRLQHTLLQNNIAQLEAKQTEINRKNLELENDLRMASEIQLALLPQTYPQFPARATAAEGCLQFYHRYQPSGTVSGDFFHVFPMPPTSVGVFICDVMGHGVRSAFVTAMLRTLVQELGHLGGNPGELLTRVNAELKTILMQTGELIYASGFFLVLDVTTGRACFAKAAHPDPIWIRSESGTAQNLVCPSGVRGAALGLFEGTRYGTATTTLAPGDAIFFFTDGSVELFDAHGVEFGEDRLAQDLAQHRLQPMPETMDAIYDEALNFASDHQFADDVCFLGLKLNRLSRVGETTAAITPPGPAA